MSPYMCGQGVDSHPRLLGGRLFAGMTVVEGGLTLTPALSRQGRGGVGAGKRADTWVRPYGGCVTLTPALSRQGRGGKSPLPLTLFSCVVGLRSPGWRAAGGGGVDGSGPGVRLVPVPFESFLDSTLGDGELRGGGFFVLFLLYALGPQGLSASGGPGGSVPASLCSGACSGPSCFVPGSFGRLGTSGVGCGATAPAAPLDSGFRRNDG